MCREYRNWLQKVYLEKKQKLNEKNNISCIFKVYKIPTLSVVLVIQYVSNIVATNNMPQMSTTLFDVQETYL